MPGSEANLLLKHRLLKDLLCDWHAQHWCYAAQSLLIIPTAIGWGSMAYYRVTMPGDHEFSTLGRSFHSSKAMISGFGSTWNCCRQWRRRLTKLWWKPRTALFQSQRHCGKTYTRTHWAAQSRGWIPRLISSCDLTYILETFDTRTALMNCTMATDFLISLSFIQASIESSQAKINSDATKLMTTVASISASVQMQRA